MCTNREEIMEIANAILQNWNEKWLRMPYIRICRLFNCFFNFNFCCIFRDFWAKWAKLLVHSNTFSMNSMEEWNGFENQTNEWCNENRIAVSILCIHIIISFWFSSWNYGLNDVSRVKYCQLYIVSALRLFFLNIFCSIWKLYSSTVSAFILLHIYLLWWHVVLHRHTQNKTLSLNFSDCRQSWLVWHL